MRGLTMPFTSLLIVLIISIISSFLGPILGIGGGSIFIPLLDIFTDMDFKEIIAISAATIPATALRSNSRYLKEKITNIRLGIVTLPFVIAGAFLGALTMLNAPEAYLRVIFGGLLFYVSYRVTKKKCFKANRYVADPKCIFTDTYFDEGEKMQISYTPKNLKKGIPLMFIGGFASGLLGIGGGIIYTPVFLLVFNAPPKVAITLSMFLIYFGTSTSAIIFLTEQLFDPIIVAVAIMGSLTGSTFGSKVALKLKNETLRKIFGLFLGITGARMILTAFL